MVEIEKTAVSVREIEEVVIVVKISETEKRSAARERCCELKTGREKE